MTLVKAKYLNGQSLTKNRLDRSCKQQDGQRQENFLRLLDHFTIGKTEKACDVFYGQPVLIQGSA